MFYSCCHKAVSYPRSARTRHVGVGDGGRLPRKGLWNENDTAGNPAQGIWQEQRELLLSRRSKSELILSIHVDHRAREWRKLFHLIIWLADLPCLNKNKRFQVQSKQSTPASLAVAYRQKALWKERKNNRQLFCLLLDKEYLLVDRKHG